MQRLLCGLIALLASAVALCGCERAEQAAQPPDDGAPAGEVVEVTGQVKLAAAPGRRDRAVAVRVGDSVAGADVIATGPDGRVAIRLHHNGALWNLGSNKRVQVNQSVAWNAAKGDGPIFGKTGRDRTQAAGRHAERQVGTTAGTAVPTRPQGQAHATAKAEAMPETRAKGGTRTRGKATSRAPAGPEPGESREVATQSDRPDSSDTAGATEMMARASPMFADPDPEKDRGKSKSKGKGKAKVAKKSRASRAAAPVMSLGKTRIEAGKRKTRAAPDRKTLRTVVARYLSKVSKCAARGPDRNASIQVRIRVNAAGKIRAVKTLGRATRLTRCADAILGKWLIGKKVGRGPYSAIQTLSWNRASTPR